MSLFDLIISRRSIRKYSGEEVSDLIVKDIIKAGMYAPSAMNTQPWHFVVMRDQAKFDGIIDVHPHSRMLKDASVAILVCRDKTMEHLPNYGTQDCAACTQNMLLATHALGLGAVWLGIFPRKERVDKIISLLKLPEHIEPFSLISIGYPGEVKEIPDRYKNDRIHFEKWSYSEI